MRNRGGNQTETGDIETKRITLAQDSFKDNSKGNIFKMIGLLKEKIPSKDAFECIISLRHLIGSDRSLF